MDQSLQREINSGVEIIKNKLYFGSLRSHPRDNSTHVFFCVDNELVYQHFFADFGPLNLGQFYRFCKTLEKKFVEAQGRKVFFYCSYDVHKRANAAFLVTGYTVLYLNRTAEEAYRPFFGVYPTFVPFRDASFGLSTYNLTILDCLRALVKAKQLGWVNFDTFDVDEYEYYERVENGDLNWTLPGKFIAFSGPHNTSTQIEDFRTFTPEDYIPLFKKWGVTGVIRFNKKCYDKRKFTDNGIKHFDLYFPDGSTPSEAIVRRFLEIVETEKGVLAVHCKAGLGRTGTLIGCYIMKHYHFTAAEAIAWQRICRPGSVIGPQQHFLQEMQARLWRQGEAYRRRLETGYSSPGSNPNSPDDVRRATDGIYGLSVDSPTKGSAAPSHSSSSPSGSGSGSNYYSSSAFTVKGTGAPTATSAGSGYRSRTEQTSNTRSHGPVSRTNAGSSSYMSRSKSTGDGFGNATTTTTTSTTGVRRPKTQTDTTRTSSTAVRSSGYGTSSYTRSGVSGTSRTSTTAKPRSTYY